jgi:PiT family inorganic phosphate transporter
MLGVNMEEALPSIAVGITLCFAFVNGFHDGGNVIATIIASRSMPPRRALFLGTVAELVGPLLMGTAVAGTIAGSIFRPEAFLRLAPNSVYVVIISGVFAAVGWKLPTWAFGLPSSSSHALISGLVGAGSLAVGFEGVAVRPVVMHLILPLLISPLLGLILGYVVFSLIRGLFGRAHRSVGRFFESVQKPVMVVLAASQGSNDAQKSMGVIALVLAVKAGTGIEQLTVSKTVMAACAVAMAVGLAMGGLRIVKSVGYDMFRMEPVHSFASQLTATSLVLGACLLGGPVSTTQVVGGSVMGVGTARSLSAVRWPAARNIAYAWFLTVPVCAGFGAGGFWLLSRIVPN